jgi:molecular chaperone DnaK (HSP70)
MNVGIDLGTTNSALSYIDAAEASEADFPPIHVLPIPQYVAPGQMEERRTLPSFLYLGGRRRSCPGMRRKADACCRRWR